MLNAAAAPASIAESEREYSKQVVATVGGRGVTVAELSAAFDKVKNRTHWKNPVAGIIPAEEFDLTAAAVTFYTGSVLQCMRVYKSGRLKGQVRVYADGYYKAIGA